MDRGDDEDTNRWPVLFLLYMAPNVKVKLHRQKNTDYHILETIQNIKVRKGLGDVGW